MAVDEGRLQIFVTLSFERVVCFPSACIWCECFTHRKQGKCCASCGPTPHKHPAASSSVLSRVLSYCVRNSLRQGSNYMEDHAERHSDDMGSDALSIAVLTKMPTV